MRVALLNMADYYAYIHKLLREDAALLELMGITPPTDFSDGDFLATMAVRIQKRKKPQNLNTESLPAISFYNNPGFRSANPVEYLVSFDFDIYTNDDVEKAILLADHISAKFEERYVGLRCCSSFRGQWTSSGEDETDQPNTYKYFTQVLFTLILND